MELRSGAVRRVRRELGIRSFGVNRYDLPPRDDYPEHGETTTSHEELYVYLAGDGTIAIDGDRVDLEPGRYVYVTREARRKIAPGPNGVSYLAIAAC